MINQADLNAILAHYGTCPDGTGSGSGVSAAQSGSNDFGIPTEIPEAWAAAGGEAGINDGSITDAQIETAMNQPDSASQITALFTTLGQ